MRPIAALFLLSFLFSCKKDKVTSEPYNPIPVPAKTFTYLALGDSYTIGQAVAEYDRFPRQTVTLLKQQGKRIADPVYIAQTGWTTSNLRSAINNQNPPTYDLVSLLIGVNDQYQRIDTTTYGINFTQLLERAILLAGGSRAHVFVVSIPDYSITPFVHPLDKARVSMEVDRFNAINRRITNAYNVSYTDITPSSREGATNPALIAPDNLHPSELEYRKWATMLAPKMSNMIY